MATINDRLSRRPDLSTFLVHLTRDFGSTTARDNLLSILVGEEVEARAALGMATELAGRNPAVVETQKVVCLSETPLEHVWSLCGPIDGRQVSMSSYGLALPKLWARSQGCNPVEYLDITPGHTWLTNSVNMLVKLAEKQGAFVLDGDENVVAVPLEDAPVLALTPFFEQMGPTRTSRKEFWWEREWRHRGNLRIDWQHVLAIFAPANDHAAFKADLLKRTTPAQAPRIDKVRLLDPLWSLERMIAELAGLTEADVNPFA
ncbi:MAG TPA: hypothetical protein DGG94_05165 [Micromonosporaceae bacterium]|nr:hypothetical protein [Micromonosporaceae bacterium]HCU49189.1 hypothetical protein [Micromonosporaceae bacterium]